MPNYPIAPWSQLLLSELGSDDKIVRQFGALTRAQHLVIPADAPRERAGHHYIDLARAYLLHGDRVAPSMRCLRRRMWRRRRPGTTRWCTRQSGRWRVPKRAASTPCTGWPCGAG
ncbi:hypothetical protein GCM10023318_09860 [Nocardia callitridis]|uniref:Uncharacterized protein n=1 Tax=Nocardia callitridis TaxID=648753 RepID=A0ABP9JXF1_9NOCA